MGVKRPVSWEFAVILFVAGVLLVVLEVFIPSFGLLTVGAIACFALSIWGLYDPDRPGPAVAMGILAPIIAVSVLYFGLKYIPRTSWGRGLVLRTSSDDGAPEPITSSEAVSLTPDGGTAEKQLLPLVGREGVAESLLRPAGVALIDGRRVDVVTEGTMVDAGSRIKVIAIEGNRVVVRRVQV